MALNIKTLTTRALSAVVFVALLLGSLLWNYFSFTGFFFIMAMIGLKEFYAISQKLGAKPFYFPGFLFGVILYMADVAWNKFNPNSYLSDLPAFVINCILYASAFFVFIIALFSKHEKPINDAVYTIVGPVYAVMPFAILNRIVFLGNHDYSPNLVLCIILLIWSNDTFAYLGGSLFGKNKMIERVSPGKTWEGTIIGTILTLGSGALLSWYFNDKGLLFYISLAAIVSVLATIGDLVESLLKRNAGVKDSGAIMPGHGGALDRFDSLIFVTPFIYGFLKLTACL